MKLVCEFEIQGLPLTINQIGRKHWTVKAAEAHAWKQRTYIAVNRFRGLELKTAKIEYIRHSTKQCDFDNLVTSFKHVQDGLVMAKLIVNDTEQVIGQPAFKWEKSKGKEGFISVKVWTEEPFTAPE
jgi:hypothetical protein